MVGVDIVTLVMVKHCCWVCVFQPEAPLFRGDLDPLRIYSSVKTKKLPILVAVGDRKLSCLHQVSVTSNSEGPSHLEIFHVTSDDWKESALLALAFIHVNWDALTALFLKGVGAPEVAKCKVKAFNSNITLQPLVGD